MDLQGLSDILEAKAKAEKERSEDESLNTYERTDALSKANAYLDVVIIILTELAKRSGVVVG